MRGKLCSQLLWAALLRRSSAPPSSHTLRRSLWSWEGRGYCPPQAFSGPHGGVDSHRAFDGPFGLLLLHKRGVKIQGSEVKQGFVIMRKGRPTQVLKTQHTQQGRGGATIQVELRDVQSGLKSSERLRTGEAIEKVFVEDKVYTYLYAEGDAVFLMEPESFDQMEVSKSFFGSTAPYLTNGMEVKVQYYDGDALSATVPERVTCTVVEAEPYFKGQTATPQYKKAVLDNGVQIMTPSFIVQGDRIVVNTAENEYMTRAKD